MTIKTKAEQFLRNGGWKPTSYPDKYSHPNTKEYVYLGRSHSIRIGRNKASSRSRTIAQLQAYIMEVRRHPPIEQKPIEQNPLTVTRRSVHSLVGSLTLEQCQEILERYRG